MVKQQYSICVLWLFCSILVGKNGFSQELDSEEKAKDQAKSAETFIRTPEDVISQKGFITDSEISLGIDIPFDYDEEFITVSTHLGLVNGSRDTSSKGNLFYSFFGIPYAKPPLGDLRFKNPEPHAKWEGIKECYVDPPACSQLDINEFLMKPKPNYIGQEDCLYLNIFTPRPNMSVSELPVLVYFHGGQYISGSAQPYKPHYLLNENIVLVVIQYRLGVLGFLSTEDEVMPGNLGLKDQAIALQWIHRNIEFFGGSPLKVSLFGSDAGASSIHFQTLSHQTIGLFSRVIMQSGNALCPWALGGVHNEVAHHIGTKLNCISSTVKEGKSKEESDNTENLKGKTDSSKIEEKQNEFDGSKDSSDNQKQSEEDKESSVKPKEDNINNSEETRSSETTEKPEKTQEDETEDSSDPVEEEKVPLTSEELLQCFQKVDAEELTMMVDDYFMWNTFPVIFGPYVDGDFLAKTPEYLLKEKRHKRLDIMIGINKDEGSFITSATFGNEGRRVALKSHFPLVGPISMEFTDTDYAPLNMSLKAYDHYLQGMELDPKNAYKANKLYGDRHYGVCTDLTAMMHSDNNIIRKKKVYYYELHHKGEKSTNDKFGLKFSSDWVSHGDELNYLFPSSESKEEMEGRPENDKRVTDIMTSMWTSFAKNGNPNFDETSGFNWEPFTSTDRKHLIIFPEPYMEDDYREEVREFWTNLPTGQNLQLFQEKFATLNQTSTSESQTNRKDEL